MASTEHPAAIVVAGGTGYVGAHIVRAIADRGIPVLALTRDERRAARFADALQGAHRSLVHPVRLDLAAGGATEQLDDIARRVGVQPRGGVAALGGWWQGGRLIDVPRETWTTLIDQGLTSHLDAARAIIPALPSDSRYILMNGIAGAQPIPDSGPISVTGAGQRMLARVLAAEHARDGIEVLELALLNPVVDSPESGELQYPGEPVLIGSAVGARVAALLLAPPSRSAGRMLRSMGRIPRD